jgi:acyl-coenzyme A synthetase/AMP-(fatty) acid ligase
VIPESPYAFEWLYHHALRSPDAPCIGTPALWLSYGAVADRVRRFAAHLKGHGIRAGERVIIALPNGPAAVVSSLAIQSLGACAVEVSTDWGAEALRYIAGQTGARCAVVAVADAPSWRTAAALQHLVLVHRDPPKQGLHQQDPSVRVSWLDESGGIEKWGAPPEAPIERACQPDPDAPAQLVYTSGTLGTRRGVIQTHRNVSANTRSICAYLSLGARDRVMAVLPLFYCYGKSLLQTHLLAGGSVYFESGTAYPQILLRAMIEQRCTGFAGVPLTFELMRRQLSEDAFGCLPLRYVTQAGGAMHPETVRWARRVFAPAQLYVMYGQTEATARLSYLPPEMAETKAGSIGRGIAGVELRVLDDCGVRCGVGVTGNLVARGDNVTPGYFGDAEASRDILRDGWLWTGDLAYRDADGYLFIAGRSKDMLKIRGYRVSPDEIEHCLCRHPAISEAAVIGMPDAMDGECAAAYVVPRSGAVVDERELKKFCRDHGPAYLVPKVIRISSALPRTPSGKIAKGQLKSGATS